MKVLIISLCILGAVLADQPQSPYWPSKFAQDFVESFTVNSTIFTNVGTYEYDSTASSTRLSRSNGKYDPFCSGYLNYDQINAPCEHLIVNNTRYMYYPDTNDCCYCCSASQGCGILKRDWLQDGEFLGNTTIYGRDAYSWVLYEGPNKPNYLWETTEADPVERQILRIARNNYVENYIQDQVRYDIQDINLPESCSLFNKCPRGKCSAIRGDSVASQ